MMVIFVAMQGGEVDGEEVELRSYGALVDGLN